MLFMNPIYILPTLKLIIVIIKATNYSRNVEDMNKLVLALSID